MVTTDAQKRASIKYQKANVKRVVLAFAPPEHDLYLWLHSHNNVSGYVKRLIREDMSHSKEG